MNELKRIRDTVEIGLSDDFLAADDPSGMITFDEAVHYEVVHPVVDMTAIDDLVAQMIKEHAKYDTAMDSAMVVEFHKRLTLTRRQASDRRIWAWLGIVKYPHYVAWRWKPSSTTHQRSATRFIGDRVRQTFSRMWWAAELTRDGNDYSLTDILLALSGFQDIYEAVFGRAFGSDRRALKTFIETAGKKKEDFVREYAKELGYALSTSVLETLNDSDMEGFMQKVSGRLEKRWAAAGV